MNFISEKTCAFFIDKIANAGVEVCGNFTISSNRELKVGHYFVGKDLVDRGMCKILRNTPFIYHTHHKDVKAYPSVEDVLTVLKQKNKIINKSIVFTSWGIWELSCGEHIEESKYEKVEKVLRFYLDQIYFETNKGMDLAYDKVKDILKRLMSKLKALHLIIILTPWKNVKYPFIV
jgi:hypothetical protein